MVDQSRIALYEYLSGLLRQVTQNVYMMSAPQELTESDAANGFIVVEVGNMVDQSEFDRAAFASVRCNVSVYVPTKSRGRLDKTKYAAFETAVTQALAGATSNKYFIETENVLSLDYVDTGNANNAYYMFIKSFLVNIDNQ